jgi:acyl-CoA reductase-like NAD-dependent aldehyde dehydrogenase
VGLAASPNLVWLYWLSLLCLGPVVQAGARKRPRSREQIAAEFTKSTSCRVIVLEGVCEVFLRRLVEATRSLVIGDPLDPATDLGPVLSVMRAADFDEALEIANSTAFKLAGGVFTRKPSHLAAARREFRVGNLYLNRGITGALVGRQPFGGFGLSGTGTKAGGSDYLLHFVEPRSCTENTLRHGFAPGLE